TECAEMGEIGEYAGGYLTGKSDSGKVKLDDSVVVALDAGPVAGSLIGSVPEKCSAADGRTES
ncbi:hypothetical protein A2U01_0117558, partial [Trifolium medium]|nr:hypothetical protein [Trifolium medium]